GPVKDQAEKQLEALLLNKQLVAKVTFPASKDGIDLKTDGTWNMKVVTRQIRITASASMSVTKPPSRTSNSRTRSSRSISMGEAPEPLATSCSRATTRRPGGKRGPAKRRAGLGLTCSTTARSVRM